MMMKNEPPRIVGVVTVACITSWAPLVTNLGNEIIDHIIVQADALSSHTYSSQRLT
jgi:hypothetical protein